MPHHTPAKSRVMARNLIRVGLIGATSVFSLATAYAVTLESTSRVGEVTLFPDAAIVKRQLKLDIPAGEHEIQLPDLPASLDPASLRVDGSASERVVIGNVDFRVRANVPETDKTETQRKVKALRVERDRVTDKVDAAENRKAMVQRLAQSSSGESKDSKLDLDLWTKALDLVGKNLQAVNDELRGLRLEIERIDGEIAALEPPADRQRPVSRDIKRVATIAVEAAGATSLTLTISYRVSGAGWRPIYDARLDTRGIAPTLELTRRAMLRQNTGEDWNEAKLTLSTLSVTRGTAAPELIGEKIGFFERPMPRVAMPMSAPAPQAAANMMRDEMEAASRQKVAAGAPARAIEEATAQVDASAYQTEFQVPG